MAFEILENNFGETGFILAGIRESGTVIAKTIQELLKGNCRIENRIDYGESG